MNLGLVHRGWIRLGVACHVRSCLAMLCNHARAGTGLDQRQRRGIGCGLDRWCPARFGRVMHGALLRGLAPTVVIGTEAASTPRGGL